MKASKKSIHVKLYDFTYDSSLPSNLCPYFWKLVWAIIVAIPNFIIQLPSYIENLFEKEYRNCEDHRKNGVRIYFVTILLFLWGFLTFHWIKAMFDCYSYNPVAANIGFGINVIVALLIAINFIMKLYENKKEVKKEKTPNIVIEFIKSKYKRYCPQINWK